jgi:hypothetical protein
MGATFITGSALGFSTAEGSFTGGGFTDAAGFFPEGFGLVCPKLSDGIAAHDTMASKIARMRIGIGISNK